MGISIRILIICLIATCLGGCETMQAISDGEIAGKAKPSNYSYSVPDRYRSTYY